MSYLKLLLFYLKVYTCLSELLHWGESTCSIQGAFLKAEDDLAGICERE